MSYPDTQLFIHGQWREAAAGETLAVFNPATGKEIGRVAHARQADLDLAERKATSEDERRLVDNIAVVEDLGGLAGGEADGNGKSKCGRAQELPVRLENPDIHANVSHDYRWHLKMPDRFCA